MLIMPSRDAIEHLPPLDIIANGYSRIEIPRGCQRPGEYNADLYRDRRVDARTLDIQSTLAWQNLTNMFPDLDQNPGPRKCGGLFPRGYKELVFEGRSGAGLVVVGGDVLYSADLTRVKVRAQDELLKNIVLRCLFPRPSR